MNNNLFIVIEGMDCIGKSSIVRELFKKVTDNVDNNKVHVETLKFPNYDSSTGKFILEALNGNYDNKCDIDRLLPFAYAMNRYQHSIFFNNIKANSVTIADRYVTSNIIHNLPQGEDITSFANYIYSMEYVVNNLRKPDLEILLYPKDYDIILRNKRSRNNIDDKMEKDARLMKVYSLLNDSNNRVRLNVERKLFVKDKDIVFAGITMPDTIEYITDELYNTLVEPLLLEKGFINGKISK